MKYVYPAIFVEDDGKIGVDIPDIKGCHTFGDNLTEAMEMAKDALEMMLVSYEDDNQDIPAPSKIKDINADGFVSYVLADTDEWRREFDNKAVKKTLSIPSWLNFRAERADINFSQTLKEALCQKLGVSL